MNIGVFSGSFNPVHLGHIMLANYLVEFADYDEVWFLVSPHNPLRKRVSPDNDKHRCCMVSMAIEQTPCIKYCDIEFSLPQPSYTIATLDALHDKYKEHKFTLIIGADNWQIFDKWFQYQRIINEYSVCVYPRRGYEIDRASLPDNVSYVDAPMIELSSTWIRESIAKGKDMTAFLPIGVYEYIKRNNLYQTIEL